MRWIVRYEGESKIGSPASRLLQIGFRQRLLVCSQTATDRVPPATSDLQPDSHRSGSASDFWSVARQPQIGFRQRLPICSQTATDRAPPATSDQQPDSHRSGSASDFWSVARQPQIGFRQTLLIYGQAAWLPGNHQNRCCVSFAHQPVTSRSTEAVAARPTRCCRLRRSA
jgi:hypothetical protein